MKATALNQAPAMVSLALIDPSTSNPRKFFSEAELGELADSISQKGVLQSILLRPLGDRFEIVYGERRYRASAIAGLTEIPATVKELTDIEAREIAITENLQRSDIAPLDEALAFKNLMEFTNCAITELTTRFGKSEQYIRGRLRLNDLLPQLGDLLSQQLISLSAAIELSRYSEEIQAEIYEDHLENEDSYNSWRDMTAKKLASNIERHYTNELKKFLFDKTACLDCPFNSSCNSLFPEPDELGKCSNSTCLNEKNAEYLFFIALQLAEKIPGIRFSYGNFKDDDLIAKIAEHGFEITKSYDTCTYPSEPVKPTFTKGTDKKDKEKLMQEYKRKFENYQSRMEELAAKLAEGGLIQYGHIESNDIALCYLKVDKPVTVTIDSEIARLEAKDQRNKEIAREKIVEDSKKLIRNADLKGEFSDIEEKALYFLMLSCLRQTNFEAMGVTGKSYLSTPDMIVIVESLTEEQKILVRRDFLVRHLPNVSGSAEKLLIEFTRQHAPDEYAAAEKEYLDIYDKRHVRLQERILALRAPKTGKIDLEKTK